MWLLSSGVLVNEDVNHNISIHERVIIKYLGSLEHSSFFSNNLNISTINLGMWPRYNTIED